MGWTELYFVALKKLLKHLFGFGKFGLNSINFRQLIETEI